MTGLKQEKNRKKKQKYWVYILLVSNGHYYTGYTNDLVRRYKQHSAGSASCKYTRIYPPAGIAQSWQISGEQGMAMKIESFIKRKPRKVKEEMIAHPDKLKRMVRESLGLVCRIKVYGRGPDHKNGSGQQS